MSKQPPKKRIPWLYIIIFAVIAIFLFNLFIGGGNADKARYNQFMTGLGYEGKDANGNDKFTDIRTPYYAIVLQGNNFYIMNHENTTAEDKKSFLKDPVRHATLVVRSPYPGQTFYLLEQRNAQVSKDNIIELDSRNVPTSFWEYATPVMYIVVIGVVLLFIYRNMSSRGGLGNMGRHRATRIIGGSLRFTDVAGIDEEKEEVQEIVDFLRNPQKFLNLGARIPKGCLLVGAPGTGKTLLAKAIAGEAQVPFLSLSGSDFSEMLVGVGPSRMRDLFEEAKLNAPCIIFIDEIDSIARMRGVGVSGVSDENEQTLNQLLVQMDGFTKSEGVIVLAATNRPDVLDQALLRPGRFDRQIIVQMPDVRGREKILEVHSRHKPIGTDVDLKRVAKIISGFSGADIENLMNESAIIAAKKNKSRINMIDITEGINKVLLGPQKRSRIISDEDKKTTAYHEAGHAIIARVLQPTQLVQEVSIIPRGMAGGYTLTNDKESESQYKSRKFLNTQIAVYMGGRLAEDLYTGDIATGSTNDLKRATMIAENMVTRYGMSEKLGPLYYGQSDEIALRMYENARHSEVLQSTIDNEIKAIVLSAEKIARDILKANEAKIHIMANVLLERETIYAEDIDLIMQGKDEKAIIAEMEKREAAAKVQEKKDRTESDLATLDKQLSATLETAGVLLENKIIDLATLVKLEDNMKLAREVVRAGHKLEYIPTLDNLDNYANLVKVPDTKPEGPNADAKPKKEPTDKKPTKSGKLTEKKKPAKSKAPKQKVTKQTETEEKNEQDPESTR